MGLADAGKGEAVEYVTGMHALNLECELGTTGDWHLSAYKWEDLTTMDDAGHPLGTWGIADNVALRMPPWNGKTMRVANHIRACLDLLVMGHYALAQGMRRDFIDTNRYDTEIFAQALRLSGLPNWVQINQFMGKEYGRDWLAYLREHPHELVA